MPTLSSYKHPYYIVGRSGQIANKVVDGVQDDVEIQQAMDTVSAGGGGAVMLRAGSAYRLAAPIVIPENVTLLGERMARQSSGGVTLKTAASVTLTNAVEMTGTSNPSSNADLKHDVQMENITLEGNSTTTNAVMLTNQDTFKAVNCRFITCTNSINTTWDSTIAPTASTIPGGIYLDRCNISTLSTGIGVILNYQTQCWIDNSWFTPGSGTPTAWFKFNCSNKVKIANSEFNTASTALWFTDVNTGGGLDFPCHNIIVAGSVFNTGGTVIDDDRTHTSSSRVFISGTMASGTTQGDSLVGTGNTIQLGPVSAPASASASGTQGQIAFDGSYAYICTAKDTWKRVAIASW